MAHIFISSFRASITLLLLFSLLLGIGYPLTVLAGAQLLFHYQADGSQIERGDKIIGSSLLGQEFTSYKYFWGRLSATTPAYNAAASGGSNFGPGNPKLLTAVNERIAALQKADPKNDFLIPVELVTASASGLDPHLSLPAVHYQVPRVAKARGMKEEELYALVNKYAKSPGYGLFRLKLVNIVNLNLALDENSKLLP